MLNYLKSLFSKQPTKELINALEAGAIIIDVRSEREFKLAHIDGAMHIQLSKIAGSSEKLRKLNKPIICCCSSGLRSGQAVLLLKRSGLAALNGGAWHKLKKLTVHK